MPGEEPKRERKKPGKEKKKEKNEKKKKNKTGPLQDGKRGKKSSGEASRWSSKANRVRENATPAMRSTRWPSQREWCGVVVWAGLK